MFFFSTIMILLFIVIMIMHSNSNYPLQSSNSFNIKASCPRIYFPCSVDDLEQLPDLSNDKFYVLGEGSNTLFVEFQAPIIIQPKFTGIDIVEHESHFIVTVGAAENWHELVCYCLEKGINGLENLALIPGSVGAAPVQNIGAYGVEFADFCQAVHWYDFSNKALKQLSKQACQFAYRDSIFKQSLYNKGLITQVTFNFPKKWQANLGYAGLDILPKNSTATQIMTQVIKLRSHKLPDPKELPNAGSFFKNPIVSRQIFEQLQRTYPNMPNYPQQDGNIKLAAGWLIELVGLKGVRHLGVGVHEHQALVLVNFSSESGQDVISLAKYIQRAVAQKFSVTITPEVRMITQQGEMAFSSLNDTHPIGNNSDD